MNWKEKIAALWAKVVENKEIAIRAGFAVAGAVVGSVVTLIVAANREEDVASYPFFEEDETQVDAPVTE